MADNANPKTLNDTGDAYFYGIGRPINRELAYTYYKQAADLDNPVGYYNLGVYFAAKKDYRNAIVHFEKAKAFLHPPAFLALARMNEQGIGTLKNKAKAFRMYLGAAKLGDLEAYDAVGACYRDGRGAKKDPEKAKEWFRKAADQNDPVGCCQLGLLLMAEKAFQKDPAESVGWLDRAASAGNTDAMRALLAHFQEGKHPALRKKSRQHREEMAFYYRELLAKAGDVPALIAVADAYRDGTEVTHPNAEKAADYYHRLLEKGEVAGKYGYGAALLYGLGVPADPAAAKLLLAEAATAQHPQAMTRLGDAARLGLGGDVDNEAAKKWYMEAARLKDPEAVMDLGLLNYRGLVEGASPQLAFGYLETATKQGYAPAWYWLGIFRDKGIGCPHDFIAAEKAFRKAIEGGNVGARYKLAAMYYDELSGRAPAGRKHDQEWAVCRKLFEEYVEDPLHNPANHAFSMYYLGLIHLEGRGIETSARRARFWFESAAEAGLGKAMVEMYRMLREREPAIAREWLDKAAADPQNGDALFEKGQLLLAGAPGLPADPKAGRSLLEAAARLNHRGAIEKLMLM